MKSFIIKLVVFVAIPLLIDNLIFTFLINNRPCDYKLFLDSKKEFFNNDMRYDILILGDSHAADAIDTRLIEEHTGLSAFNLGVYHSSI